MKSKKSKPVLPSTETGSSGTWNVRVMAGSEITDVTLEEADPSSDTIGWRIGTPDGPRAFTAAESVTEEPGVAEEPAEEDEEPEVD